MKPRGPFRLRATPIRVAARRNPTHLARKTLRPGARPGLFMSGDRHRPTAGTVSLPTSGVSWGTALMIPAATDLQARCRELKLPIVIVTGADDKIADVG